MASRANRLDGKRKDEIDSPGLELGHEQLGVGARGRWRHGSGKVNVQDLSLTKYIDVVVARISCCRCCNGKHIPKAQLTVRKAGENALEYLIIKFEDILIASVSTGGSGGEDRLTENVTLNFAKVDVEYTQQDAKGGAGAKPKMGWDIPANAKR